MSVTCEFVLQRNASPEELTALGTALWRWCDRKPDESGIYRHLDNQPLADLIAGKFPQWSQGDAPGVHFRLRDEGSDNRQATIASLRIAIPVEAVEDIVVDGASWNRDDSEVRRNVTP